MYPDSHVSSGLGVMFFIVAINEFVVALDPFNPTFMLLLVLKTC